MDVRYIKKIREAVGKEKLSVLTDIFRNSKGTPPGVPAARYRADHPQWIDVLAQLEADQKFLRRDHSGRYYLPRVFAFPILDEIRAQELLNLMSEIFGKLKTLYGERLAEPVKVKEIADLFPPERSGLVKEALYYMTDSHSVWSGLSNGFPYDEDSYMCVSEAVLRYENFVSVLSEFYEWHISNPKKEPQAWPVPKTAGIKQQLLDWGNRPPTRVHWLIGVLLALAGVIVAILLKLI